MTPSEIWLLWGSLSRFGHSGRVESFAALVAAAEREACADILDRNADRCDPHNSIVYEVLASNAAAIRARSTP